MLAYKIIEDKVAGQIVKRQVFVKFSTDKDFWREFDSLLPDASGLAPTVVENALSLARSQRVFPTSVMILGQKYNLLAQTLCSGEWNVLRCRVCSARTSTCDQTSARCLISLKMQKRVCGLHARCLPEIFLGVAKAASPSRKTSRPSSGKWHARLAIGHF